MQGLGLPLLGNHGPFERQRPALPPLPPALEEAATTSASSSGRVHVSLEALPQVCTCLCPHSENDLLIGIAQAFGFRSSADFELLRPPGLDGRPGPEVLVRVLSRPFLSEVACLEGLFAELPDTFAEVVYLQLARITGVPLLRLHRVIALACGAAVASWFEAYHEHEELTQATGLRDQDLRNAAATRFWRVLQARVEAVFPGLVSELPEYMRQPPPPSASAEERLACCSRLFSTVVDEVRLRVLPLRMQRVIANGSCSLDSSQMRPGSKRLLRVFLEGGAQSSQEDRGEDAGQLHAEETERDVMMIVLDASSDAASQQKQDMLGRVSSSFTGHELYYQVSRFFGLPHVQVKTRDGVLVSLEKPHEPLLGQLPCSTDGICIDLVVSQYQPKPGSFDQLYREVLRILGPRHFQLDQSYRLQIPCSEELLTTTQGTAIITTVILIPVNFLEGKQMYLFRSPRYRQCKAAMRTFEEFKEMLQALVQVYGLLTNQISPSMAERLRRACAEGAPGQTPLAPFETRRGTRLSHTWSMMHGCTQAGRSAMGLLGGLQTAPSTSGVGGSVPALWWFPEDVLLDPGFALHTHDAFHEYHDFVGMLNLLGGPFTGDTATQEARRIFDIYGIEPTQVTDAHLPYWRPGLQHGEAATDRHASANPWADPWSIAVGGLVGIVFGLLEGVYGKMSEHRHGVGGQDALILEKMARRGTVGLGASALFHVFGRLLRLCLPDGRYATLSRKSIPTSQAVVFLGTFAWAVCSHHQYVEPSVMRRLWHQDLNLAERQAAGIIFTSGLACSFTVGGYLLGMHVLGGSLGGPAGAFAGSLMPMFITLVITGLDWWHDRVRRRQMKAAALQTLGLPEPGELGIDVFKPMLSARYKLLACYLHPDKNDSCRCDTTTVFSQIRLAKEILEQELKDYQSCPRERLRRLFEQMVALCGYRKDRYVSELPSGVIMNIIEDGLVEDSVSIGVEEEPTARADLDSITTVESRSVAGTPPLTPRPHRQSSDTPEPQATIPEVPGEEGRLALDEDIRLPSPAASGEPWVIVPGASGSNA